MPTIDSFGRQARTEIIARSIMRIALGIPVMGFVVVGLHAAQQRPALADWNGLTWGMSVSASETVLGQPLKPAGGTESTDRLAADNCQVDGYNARVALTFLRDRLAGIMATYDDLPFDTLAASLSNMYGEPTVIIRPPLVTTRPVVRRATWEFSNAVMTLVSVYTPSVGSNPERTATMIEINPR